MCVCVHVAFKYMHIHDCTFTEIHSGREERGGGGRDDSEGDEERERKGGVYTYIILKLIRNNNCG